MMNGGVGVLVGEVLDFAARPPETDGTERPDRAALFASQRVGRAGTSGHWTCQTTRVALVVHESTPSVWNRGDRYNGRFVTSRLRIVVRRFGHRGGGHGNLTMTCWSDCRARRR